MKEIADNPTFLAWAEKSPEFEPAAIQDLELHQYADLILRKSFPDSIFLSCDMDALIAGHIVQTGGVVIPELKGFKFQVHRSSLYGVEDLFRGFDLSNPKGYEATYDFGVYEEYCAQGRSPKLINTSLARKLHDHSIAEALDNELVGRKVVAIMGGHSMERRDPLYAKAANVSRQLTQAGYLMVSGGGPGAMEATHLGAYFATKEDGELEAALEMLRPRPTDAKPGKEYTDPDWLHRAWRVREAFPIASGQEEYCKSIGIPTWFYGHEPPAPFATHIAKFFSNAIREDGLLAIANFGVIFFPGSAGTIQEIFQDAAQNHYATHGLCSPMILFGEDYWTNKILVWQLLQAMSAGKNYGQLVGITDSEDEIIRRIEMFVPEYII